MGKNKNKNKQKAKCKNKVKPSWSSLPWQSVAVGSEDRKRLKSKKGDSDGTEDEDEFMNGKNHYDDPNANPSELYDPFTSSNSRVGGRKKSKFHSRSAEDDKVEGADDPGIFVGLEVIDGSQYQIEKVEVPGGVVNRLVVTSQEDCKIGSLNGDLDGKQTDGNSNDNSNSNKQETKLEDKTSQQKEKNHIKHKKEQQEKITQKKDEDRKSEKNAETKGKNSQTQTKKRKLDKKQNKGIPVLPTPTQEQIEQVQTSWCVSAGGIYLHPHICKGLTQLQFSHPTSIQASTLAASILGNRDIVAAAPTGSGKTLCYVLPILQALLQEMDEEESQTQSNDTVNHNRRANSETMPLQALVMCPTRELAIQVSAEFSKLSQSKIACGTIVGGLAEQKQKRVLNVKRPPILVATPGRLWELMSTKEHPHLENLSKLRFLVIDEADRMISQGNFPQLTKIFEAINEANPPPPSQEEIDQELNNAYNQDGDDDDDDENRLKSLQGVRGESKVTMLNPKILRMIELQRVGKDIDDKDHNNSEDGSHENDENNTGLRTDEVCIPKPIEVDDEEFEAQQRELLANVNDDENNSEINDDIEDEEDEPVHRQTFIFSATLTLPPSSHRNIKFFTSATTNGEQKRGKKARNKSQTVDGAIAEILEKAGARGQTKVVDLSSFTGEGQAQSTKAIEKKTNLEKKLNGYIFSPSQSNIRLPPGLTLQEIECTQKHKDSHLYAYLTTTKQGSSGPSLVFCNSIAAVKRVAETLRILGLPARSLHAQMQQKARLSALESIKQPKSRSIVVATDVAARGLDIPSVSTVVHYDVARAIDTFVHRAGRTARGLGDKAIGWSISLVAASEDKEHRKICEAIYGQDCKNFDVASIDGRLLSAAQARVSLATKIVTCEEVESKARKNNQWFSEAAEEAGLDLDDDLLDDGLIGGSRKDRQRLIESKQARAELRQLLAKPMRKQTFGKFLSGVGLSEAIKAENEVKPYIVNENVRKSKKKRKKR